MSRLRSYDFGSTNRRDTISPSRHILFIFILFYVDLKLFYKRYAIQNVFRNEKSGNARFREFTQADCDIVGNVNPAQANAELCNLVSSTLIECGLKKDQFTINVSNRKIIQGLIQDLKIPTNKEIKVMTVSYTHLTLPTKASV